LVAALPRCDLCGKNQWEKDLKRILLGNEAIARGLLDAFRRRDELPSMGEAAKEAVRQMTWRHAAERLVAAYTSAVSGGTIEPAAI